MKMIRLVGLTLALLLCGVSARAQSGNAAGNVVSADAGNATAQAAARAAEERAKKRPNLELSMSDHVWMSDEDVTASISFYNLPGARVFVSRISSAQLAQTPADLEHLPQRIRAISAGASVNAFAAKAGKSYPNNWTYREIKVPTRAPGVYLLRAVAKGLEKRTWFAITDIGLLLKRGRRELLVYATRGNNGVPLPNLALRVRGDGAQTFAGATGKDGVLRLPVAPNGNLWVMGERNGEPAFALSGGVAAPDPFSVHAGTDRPIYRPGAKVSWKGIVRRHVEAAQAPGGFRYDVYAQSPVEIEVRDPTDALISRQRLKTDAYGSYASEIQLSGEPPLGAWQLVTRIGDYRAYSSFEVQAFRKPEYAVSVAFEQPHYLNGDAIPVTIRATYFWGQPVVNAQVKYTISFQGGDTEPDYSGEGQTDAKGELHLRVQTQRKNADRALNVSANITDLSRRTQASSGSTLVAAARFRVSLSTDKSVYKAGEKVTATLHIEDYDGQPVQAATARVTLLEPLLDRNKKPNLMRTPRDLTTNVKGDASATFSLPRPGYLTIEAQAKDASGNVVKTQTYVWVAGGDAQGYNYPTLDIVPDKPSYLPGDSAQLLIQTDRVDAKHKAAYALITVEGEQLGAHQVVKLSGRSTPLRVPLSDAQFPSVQANVVVVQDGQITEKGLRLRVERPNDKLQVEVSPDKAEYRPGETATYSVKTLDYQGRPVPAQVALGVVDASIYALRADTTPEINGFFWRDQTVRVQTDWSFAREYSGGGMQTIPREGDAPQEAPRVRRRFLDTAYWNPFVQTDANGSARVRFEMPDNLTTWRATARGITTQTQAGQSTRDALVSMPLQVRLELPRFYVAGDNGAISIIVHNYTLKPQSLTVSADATGATLDGGDKSATLEPGGQTRLEWNARISAPKDQNTMPRVRFSTSAQGSSASDAMELSLPVLPRGLKMTNAEAFSLDNGGSRSIDLSKVPADATLTLQMSPSLAGALFDAVTTLQNYPYGCSEQTMSQLLPDVAVSRALVTLGRPELADKRLPQMVNVGLQTLYRYQHSDGGWNLWDNDPTDADMTAYVLWGLLQAREAGYTVDEARISRGAQALARLSKAADESHVADYLEPLSLVNPEVALQLAPILWKSRDKLDARSIASLALACHNAASKVKNGAPLRQIANDAAALLERKAITRGTLTHWTAEEGGYSWRNDDIETSAHVLRALLSISPRSKTIAPSVRWLMSQREAGTSGAGSWWGTTKATSEAVLALTQFMTQSGELNASYTATAALDGREVRSLKVSRENILSASNTLRLRPDEWRGAKTLNVQMNGTGALYATMRQDFILPPEAATPRDNGIAVRRSFTIETLDPSQANLLAPGAKITVNVEMTASDNYRYALLEDPIPAGCEVQGDDDNYYNRPYQRRETRDDRVAFFFNALPKGRTNVSYTLVCEAPGEYSVLPSVAQLFYFPEVRGNAGLVGTKVEEQRLQIGD